MLTVENLCLTLRRHTYKWENGEQGHYKYSYSHATVYMLQQTATMLLIANLIHSLYTYLHLIKL